MSIIAIEGLNRAGKTTLVNKFKESFPGFEYVKYPKDDPATNELLEETNPFLLSLGYYINKLKDQERIKELKNKGANIIIDRYILSGIVYAKERLKNPVEMDIITKLENLLIQPTITIYIKTTPEVAYKRDSSLDINKMHQIKNLYEEEIKKINSCYEVNGDEDPDTVFENVKLIIASNAEILL